MKLYFINIFALCTQSCMFGTKYGINVCKWSMNESHLNVTESLWRDCLSSKDKKSEIQVGKVIHS